jgi:hypothetical protein
MKMLLVSCLLVTVLVASASALDKKSLVGTWSGELNVAGMKMPISFNINDSTGTLTATMDSPSQGAFGVPMDTVRINGDTLRIVMVMYAGKYEGVVASDGHKISGTWFQGGMALELNLEKSEKAAQRVARPQEPTKPYPYIEEEVTFENKEAGITLAGTFTKPSSGEPFTAVLLITGSGLQDRDETLLGHKPFLVLADYLTRQGLAVLRVDDRGVGKSTGDPARATSKDFAGDVKAGIAYLKTQKCVNPTRIGLAGHSEGGIIAPMVAAESRDVAFMVLMAGTGIAGDTLMKLQGKLIGLAEGNNPSLVEANTRLQGMMFRIVEEESDSAKAETRLRQAFRDWKSGLDSTTASDFAQLDSTQFELQIRLTMSPWLKFFLSYDPIPALKKVKCPVLAINGDKDLQVPADYNLPPIEQALKAGGNKNYKVVKLEGLNHLFQHSKTGAVTEYGAIEETFAPEAMELIASWIKSTGK